METVFIDGSMGEGGGQILRTSLALSCITGKSLHIEKIRAARRNPGLAKQHLSCIQAACQISNGKSQGAVQGSQVLDFQPGSIHCGDFSFDIGSAGSASLVIQTILPALLLADKSSTITVSGGTHNPLAPPFDFIHETFLPTIATAGFHANCKLEKFGFFPVGGGKITLRTQPWQKQKHQIIDLCEPSSNFKLDARIYTARLPIKIAQRQKKLLQQVSVDIDNIGHIEVTDSDGPGTAVCIRICGIDRTIVFTAFGKRGKPSESVIGDVVGLTKSFLGSRAAVDRFLADQLLIYMAIANRGCYTTDRISSHTETNMEVIKKFLLVDFIAQCQGNLFRVSCQSDQ